MRPDYLVVADVTTTDPLQAVTVTARPSVEVFWASLLTLQRMVSHASSGRARVTARLRERRQASETQQDRIDIIVQVHRFGDGRCESPKSWTWMPFKKFIQALITSPRQVKCRDGTKTHLDSVRNYPTISLPESNLRPLIRRCMYRS